MSDKFKEHDDAASQVAAEASSSFKPDQPLPEQGIDLKQLADTVNDGLTTVRAAMQLLPQGTAINNADLFFSTGILWLSQAIQEAQTLASKQNRRKIMEAAAASKQAKQ